MTITLITIAIASALILALYFLNRRSSDAHHSQETRGLQAAQLRRRAGQVEDLIHSWQRVSSNRALSRELYQIALELLDRVATLDPDRSYADQEQQRLLLVEDDTPATPLTIALPTTGDVQRLHNDLKEIKRILRSRANSESLTRGQYELLSRDVDLTDARVAINTYLAISQDAVDEQQWEKAEKLLQQAIEVVQSSPDLEPELHHYQGSMEALSRKIPHRPAAGE